jgi:hypothetical protein
MLLSALNYLSDPLIFAGFSILVGIAYVIIWVLSLRELGKGDRTTYKLIGMRGEPGQENRDSVWRRGNPRNTVRVRVPGKARSANNGRARVTRAA